jgi:hypothetical protein
MPSLGVIVAVCTLLLAADGLARPAAETAPAPQPECRFTLERGARPADDEAETWVLTCHRSDAAAPPASQAVSLRRVVMPKLPAGN